ncbi:MAG: alpha-L-fucosidase [Opitutus sp.]
MNAPLSSCFRSLVVALAVLSGARLAGADAPAATAPYQIAAGPFEPTWESLARNYRVPVWFRDAKFGIWAHWSAQCVPEQGDWYAREMYQQDSRKYKHHLATYGHPSKSGFMEIDHLWTAEKWDPEKLMTLYQRAGARYFVALANHHDNFDNYDSKYHAWNSVNVGPKRDIVGTWAQVARAHGLRLGVSNHSAHAWHWFQTAYGYDGEGEYAGVRYDAFKLTKADGKGKWWDGLDPQELYTGPNMVIPDGLKSAKAVEDWHARNDLRWNEEPPPNNPGFTQQWFLRCQDLVDKYHPDLLYFDNRGLPLGDAGLNLAAHYYNANPTWNSGRQEAVINVKGTAASRRGAVIDDIERGVAEGIRPKPWQTDTCIGSWHYDRSLFTGHKYKTVGQVVRMLVDIVSKNGNLLLSIPLRGDGTIDEDEVAFLEGLARWMSVNSEAIFSTRPWIVLGEGMSAVEAPEAGHFGGAKDVRSRPYTSEDIRFTATREAVYAIAMDWPSDRKLLVKSLPGGASGAANLHVDDVTLLGHTGKLTWTQDDAGLHVDLPDKAPSEHAVALKILGVKAR